MSFVPDTFEVGEVAIFWNPGGKKHLTEVTIAAPLKHRRCPDGYVPTYLITERDSKGVEYAVKPEWLRKKRPPATQWSDCAWQPAKVKA